MDWIEVEKRLQVVAGSSWLSPRLNARIQRAKRLYVACSGGVDSVFLTLFFSGTGLRDRLSVLHFNHQLRGEDSEGDEDFVKSLCSSLGIELASGSWDRLNEKGLVSEEAARNARMDFFSEIVGDRKDEAVILTGHHADDIAETMLMRISRGSGLQGLCAPRAVSEGASGLRFIRPLLTLRKREIADWLALSNGAWREDQSNQETDYYRNRLRQNVIPNWELASERPVSVGAALSRELLEEDWIALEESFAAAWCQIEIEDGLLDWERLAKLPRAFQRRALHKLALERSNTVLSSAAIEGALEAIRFGAAFKVSIDEVHWLSGKPKDRVRVLGRAASVKWAVQDLPLGTTLFLPDGSKLEAFESILGAEQLVRIQSGEFSHDNTVFLTLSAKQTVPLRVGRWQPGDAYRPMGRESVVKLKELFIDRKIPREERILKPIITNGIGEILWVPGLPPNRDYRLIEGATRALRLTYHK